MSADNAAHRADGTLSAVGEVAVNAMANAGEALSRVAGTLNAAAPI